MFVVDDAEERYRRIYRDHKQYTDNVSLLVGYKVVGGVAEDEVKRYQDRDEAEYRAESDAETVEGDVAVCRP